MRSSAEGLVLCFAALACEVKDRPPGEGVARPLVLGSADASQRPPRPGLGCVPGVHRCVGEKLEACDPQDGFVQVNVCQTAAHCNAKLRQCLVDPCILGEHQCNGAVLEQCHANGWTVVARCDSEAACDAEKGSCR
ncbi:MAG: hypothetical protein U0263_23365 [Polyangiaceae bacterium]